MVEILRIKYIYHTTVWVMEWISNHTPQIVIYVIAYPRPNLKLC